MIIINPTYNILREELLTIPQHFSHDGEIIYDSRNQIRTMQLSNGQEVCVKRFHTPQGINNLVYSLGLRKPKGQRAFEYPQRLLANGIETPVPLAYIEERKAGLLGLSYLISEKCPYTHLLYELGDASEGTYEALAIALAHMTAHMHDKGILHRDFSPGNILWERTSDNEYHFSLVDINRMYFGLVSMKEGCQNFARLWGPKQFFLLIVDEYARQRGFDPETCKQIALTERARFWKRYMKKRDIEFKLEL